MTTIEKTKMSTYKKNITDRNKDPSKTIIREIQEMEASIERIVSQAQCASPSDVVHYYGALGA